MIKKKMYRYIGENGVLDTIILIPDAKHIKRYRLIAEENKLLTNGIKITKMIDIFATDLEEWYEIDDPSVKKD